MKPSANGGETFEGPQEINLVLLALRTNEMPVMADGLEDNIKTEDQYFIERHPDVAKRRAEIQEMREDPYFNSHPLSNRLDIVVRLANTTEEFRRLTDERKGKLKSDTLEVDIDESKMCMLSIQSLLKNKRIALSAESRVLAKSIIEQYRQDIGQSWYERRFKKLS